VDRTDIEKFLHDVAAGKTAALIKTGPHGLIHRAGHLAIAPSTANLGDDDLSKFCAEIQLSKLRLSGTMHPERFTNPAVAVACQFATYSNARWP
jgi:hypothetical protein